MTDPKALAASATAQEAGELLARPEVRAVLVVDGDRLVGVVTADGARRAGGRRGTRPARDGARRRRRARAFTARPDMPVEDAFR